jgi:hypothetical protein
MIYAGLPEGHTPSIENEGYGYKLAHSQTGGPFAGEGSMNDDIRDVFICHASEDKDLVVRPMVEAFKQAGITCWLDEVEIGWGHSISKKVNEGLRKSRYVIVVFSSAFLQKNWPRRELDAALNIEAYSGEVKVLPLLVGTEEERRQILKQFPLLSDKLFEQWNVGTQSIISSLKSLLDTQATAASHPQAENGKKETVLTTHAPYVAEPASSSTSGRSRLRRVRWVNMVLLGSILLLAMIVIVWLFWYLEHQQPHSPSSAGEVTKTDTRSAPPSAKEINPQLSKGPEENATNGKVDILDNFTQDHSLSTAIWIVNGPVATAALRNADSPPAVMVWPTLTLSATQGLGMSGINGSYQALGIQSIQCFIAPFTVTAQCMATSSGIGGLSISSQNGGSGIAIGGGKGLAKQWIGFWFSSPNGPGTYWQQLGKLSDMAPQPGMWYTFAISVDFSGKATVRLSSGSALIGQAIAAVGTGPFYVILGQTTGYAYFTPPRTYWRSIQIKGPKPKASGSHVFLPDDEARKAIMTKLGIGDIQGAIDYLPCMNEGAARREECEHLFDYCVKNRRIAEGSEVIEKCWKGKQREEHGTRLLHEGEKH